MKESAWYLARGQYIAFAKPFIIEGAIEALISGAGYKEGSKWPLRGLSSLNSLVDGLDAEGEISREFWAREKLDYRTHADTYSQAYQLLRCVSLVAHLVH
jgi:hypothetical protein